MSGFRVDTRGPAGGVRASYRVRRHGAQGFHDQGHRRRRRPQPGGVAGPRPVFQRLRAGRDFRSRHRRLHGRPRGADRQGRRRDRPGGPARTCGGRFRRRAEARCREACPRQARDARPCQASSAGTQRARRRFAPRRSERPGWRRGIARPCAGQRRPPEGLSHAGAGHEPAGLARHLLGRRRAQPRLGGGRHRPRAPALFPRHLADPLLRGADGDAAGDRPADRDRRAAHPLLGLRRDGAPRAGDAPCRALHGRGRHAARRARAPGAGPRDDGRPGRAPRGAGHGRRYRAHARPRAGAGNARPRRGERARTRLLRQRDPHPHAGRRARHRARRGRQPCRARARLDLRRT